MRGHLSVRGGQGLQKALKTANSEKFVFSCQTLNVVPDPPNSLVFDRGSERGSPPRFRLVTRQPAKLVTAFVTAPSCKKRSKRQSPKSSFFASDGKWDA